MLFVYKHVGEREAVIAIAPCKKKVVLQIPPLILYDWSRPPFRPAEFLTKTVNENTRRSRATVPEKPLFTTFDIAIAPTQLWPGILSPFDIQVREAR